MCVCRVLFLMRIFCGFIRVFTVSGSTIVLLCQSISHAVVEQFSLVVFLCPLFVVCIAG